MVGSCVDQRVFEVLLAENMPRVHQHITEVLELPIAWFSLPWFLCLYIGKLDLKVPQINPRNNIIIIIIKFTFYLAELAYLLILFLTESNYVVGSNIKGVISL